MRSKYRLMVGRYVFMIDTFNLTHRNNGKIIEIKLCVECVLYHVIGVYIANKIVRE